MQEENTKNEQESSPVSAPEETPVNPVESSTAIKSVHTQVAELVKDNSVVVKRVVDHLVEKDREKKANALIAGLEKLKTLQADLNKIRPKPQYDFAGKRVEGLFTKEENETRKKAQEALAKHEKALTKALEKGDFGDLN